MPGSEGSPMRMLPMYRKFGLFATREKVCWQFYLGGN